MEMTCAATKHLKMKKKENIGAQVARYFRVHFRPYLPTCTADPAELFLFVYPWLDGSETKSWSAFPSIVGIQQVPVCDYAECIRLLGIRFPIAKFVR